MTPRFCLACGGRLAARRADGRTRRTCRRCAWTYYGNPVPAAVAALARGDHVLLARRAGPPWAGTWDLPGGFIEGGESAERALRRELWEELRLRLGPVRFLGAYPDVYGPGGSPVLTIVYRAAPGQGQLIRARDDVSEVRWFPLAAPPLGEIAFSSVRAALRDLRALRGR